MSIPVQPVTCQFYDQGGDPVALARVQFTLNKTESYNGLIAPEKIDAVADAHGALVVNLFPNALGVNGSMYQVRAWNPATGKNFLDTTCTVPDSPCNLHQIITEEPYPAIDASQQAPLGAQAALAQATTQADLAAADRVQADAAATAATTQAATATAQAAIATAQANLATSNGAAQVASAALQVTLAAAHKAAAASAAQAEAAELAAAAYATQAQATNPDAPIRLNPRAITTTTAIPSAYNAQSTGPLSIADGITVTVQDNTTWAIN